LKKSLDRHGAVAGLDKHFEEPAKEVDANQRDVGCAVRVDVSPNHVLLCDMELLAENEARLVDCAHPCVDVGRGESVAKMSHQG